MGSQTRRVRETRGGRLDRVMRYKKKRRTDAWLSNSANAPYLLNNGLVGQAPVAVGSGSLLTTRTAGHISVVVVHS